MIGSKMIYQNVKSRNVLHKLFQSEGVLNVKYREIKNYFEQKLWQDDHKDEFIKSQELKEIQERINEAEKANDIKELIKINKELETK